MKGHKIILLLIASIALLAGCEANSDSDVDLSAVDEQSQVEASDTMITTAKTMDSLEVATLVEAESATEAVTEITTETTVDTTTTLSSTEAETTVTETEAEISGTTTVTEIVTEETTTVKAEEKIGFYFDAEDGYAEHFVDDLTGNPELFEHFNDALFIYRELYTGIGFMPSKVFENHGSADQNTGLVSTGVAYSDYEEFLGLYFTERFIEELENEEFIVNVDGEVYYNDWFMGARGSDIFFVGAELTIAEKTDEQMTLTLTSYFSGKEIGDYSFEDKTEVYDIVVINTENGWRFDNMTSIC